MKTKLFLIALFGLFLASSQAQTFQKEIQHNTDIYHDLNIDVINDGTKDFIVASNIFDSSMNSSEISLKRMDENGNVVWAKKYSDSVLPNARVFDVTNMYDFVVITGSIDVGNFKRTFIAKIEAASGNVIEKKYYNIPQNFNSTGLNIVYTDSDANNDGTSDPGFIVGGFFSSCYDLDSACSINAGFVLRVDQFLNIIWTKEVDSQGTSGANNDYDFVNKITDTGFGFFLTGSATGLTSQGMVRQGALAYYMDYEGNPLWNSSYIYGNSRDVSVDAYYEPTTGYIYMLSNYSSMHNFGISVFDQNGVIINNLSWVINSNDFGRYGFTLKPSVDSFSNLVVFGYDRQEEWIDINGDVIEAQSNVFIYEFEKATGDQVSLGYQYLTPHMETPGDEYNFWDGQFPLIYYPDMATIWNDTQGSPGDYLTVGYRTIDGTSGTQAEITRTNDKKNTCDNMEIVLPQTSIVVTNIPVISGNTPNTEGNLNLDGTDYTYSLTNCDGTLGIEDSSINGTGKIFPNPTNGELNIYLDNSIIQSLSIYSVLGQKVKSEKLSGADHQATIDVSDLQLGIYFINVTDNLNKTQTFKFIKN